MNDLPVFIVDDDWDERYLVHEIWRDLDLKNPLLFFSNAEELLTHMKLKPDPPPFIIISDVNLPETDGFELREILLKDESAKYKSIPFIFWSVKASERQIRHAYDLSAHGFFIKENTVEEIKKTFQSIIQYWLKSKIPE